MKSVIAILIALSSVSAFAEKQVLCGEVAIDNSTGMLMVVSYYLNVPAGPFSPGFTPVQIEASGTDFRAIQVASDIQQSLKNGENVCLEGEVFQDKQFNTIIVPARRVK
jgi:hypothetical protein